MSLAPYFDDGTVAHSGMVGAKFGRLTVVKAADGATHAKARWECVCECGRPKTVRGDHLRGGYSRSCGCLAADARRARPKPDTVEMPCTECGHITAHLRRGWCTACYQRWYKAGCPDAGPPPQQNTTLADWREIPIPAIARPMSDLAAGTAGEHLVCADLLLSGFNAFRTDQLCAYDVAVDVGALLRVQVKSTRSTIAIPNRNPPVLTYRWHPRRAGKGARRRYGENEFDLYALVALDIRAVAYVPPAHAQAIIDIRPPGTAEGRQFSDYPFARALAGIGMLP